MLPRLTEIGDTFTGVVASCTPQETAKGDAVVFTFEGHDDDSLMWSRLGVDAALLRLGYSHDPGDGADNIIDYAGTKGERLTFSRVKPIRGTKPGCRIDRPATTTPAPVAVPPTSGNVGLDHTAIAAPRVPDLVPLPKNEMDEGKRRVIRDAYLREMDFVLGEPVKRAKKAKAILDVNAAVATLMIAMDRRGCL